MAKLTYAHSTPPAKHQQNDPVKSLLATLEAKNCAIDLKYLAEMMSKHPEVKRAVVNLDAPPLQHEVSGKFDAKTERFLEKLLTKGLGVMVNLTVNGREMSIGHRDGEVYAGGTPARIAAPVSPSGRCRLSLGAQLNALQSLIALDGNGVLKVKPDSSAIPTRSYSKQAVTTIAVQDKETVQLLKQQAKPSQEM